MTKPPLNVASHFSKKLLLDIFGRRCRYNNMTSYLPNGVALGVVRNHMMEREVSLYNNMNSYLPNTSKMV